MPSTTTASRSTSWRCSARCRSTSTSSTSSRCCCTSSGSGKNRRRPIRSQERRTVMDIEDRRVIEDLFAKLGEVERKAPPRDGEAEAFIRARIAEQPEAPYYMAQTIVVQERALAAAQARNEELEQIGREKV